MKEAGCSMIHFGLESGSDRMLRAMGKKTTVQSASEAVRAAKKAGIGTDGFFMVGFPGEDTSSLLATVEMSSRLPLDRMSYSIAYPLPGTPFYESVQERLLPERLAIEGSFPLAFKSELSETKLRAAMLLASLRFRLRRGGRVGRTLDALAAWIGRGVLRWLK
jgi:anaerobic magnesium-protoporphyrin IX monomethyl ester cyclase